MKLSFFNNKDNFLLLYPVGTGGEIITSALSECVPNINKIPRKEAYPIGTNRWHSICKHGYSKDTFEPKYIGEDDPHKHDLYKDHYHSYDTKIVTDYWDSNMTVICFDTTCNRQYWTNLAWTKLNEVQELRPDFLKKQTGSMEQDHDNLSYYTNYFKKSYILNIDELNTSCVKLADQLQNIFPNLRRYKFEKIINRWIKKNNKTLKNFTSPEVFKAPMSFDLDIVRTSQERIEMILHPDCPIEVMAIVAEYDKDQEVLEALWLRKDLPSIDTPRGRKIRTLLKLRIDTPVDELEKTQDNILVNKERWKAFCPIAWNHLATNADGSIRMCCQMIHDPYGTVYKEDGNVLTGKDDITQHRNAPVWKKLRQDMLNGIDPEVCKLCTHEEENGIGSKRQWTRKLYEDVYHKAVKLTEEDGTIKDEEFPITYMDLRFGNKCNLKCRSCGPTDSSLWYDDWVQMRPDGLFDYRGHNRVKIETLPDGTNTVPNLFEPEQTYTKLWSHIMNNLDTIKRYYFTGGEPTINLKHRELLDYYINRGTALEVTLDYNTNMAGVPGKVFEQWKNFKQVNLGMSIDGINSHFEFIRHPGKFSTVLKNMRRVDREKGFERLIASITLTLSVQNVLHYPEMQWWMKEQNWNRIEEVIIVHNLYGPDILNIQNLPIQYKKYIDKKYKKFLIDLNAKWNNSVEEKSFCRRVEQRCKSILMHLWDKEPNVDAYDRLWPYMEQLDAIRNEDWKQSLPDIAQMIKECNEKET